MAAANPRGFRGYGEDIRGILASDYGLDQRPVVLMIENYRSGLPWRLMRDCAPVLAGLRRAGFSGGWLGEGSGAR